MCAEKGFWKQCNELCGIELREAAPRRLTTSEPFKRKEIRQMMMGCMTRNQCVQQAKHNFAGRSRIYHECGINPKKSVCRSCAKTCINDEKCTHPEKGLYFGE